MITDKIAQKLSITHLSDIGEQDAYAILFRALDNKGMPFYAFSHCITDFVCSYFRTNRASILKVRNDLWDKFQTDGCYTVEGEVLEELKRRSEGNFAEYSQVTFWTPLAMLRLATYLQNPIANSVRVQIAAFAASKTASSWRINESSALQPELGSPPHEILPLQPELGSLKAELGSILGGSKLDVTRECDL